MEVGIEGQTLETPQKKGLESWSRPGTVQTLPTRRPKGRKSTQTSCVCLDKIVSSIKSLLNNRIFERILFPLVSWSFVP